VDEEKKMNNPWETIFMIQRAGKPTTLVVGSSPLSNRVKLKRLKNEVLMNRAEINQLIDEVRSSTEFDERV
jgi:hypothetical protein